VGKYEVRAIGEEAWRCSTGRDALPLSLMATSGRLVRLRFRAPCIQDNRSAGNRKSIPVTTIYGYFCRYSVCLQCRKRENRRDLILSIPRYHT